MTNKIIPFSGMALALALATGFMRLSGAVASQRRTTVSYTHLTLPTIYSV